MFVTRAVMASILLWLSAYPTFADVSYRDQCIEGTKTHLPVYVWQETARNPKGVVLLLHGIAERACTLDCLAQKLVSDDFLVYGLDERGHGWWHFHQKKGDPGYKCDFSQTVNDVDKLLFVLKEEHPGLPVFLIGESVGAAVAWRAAVHRPDAVDGIVAAGTGCTARHVKISWVISDLLRNCYRWNHQINIVRYQLKYGTDDLPAFEETLKDTEQRKTLSLSEIMGANKFLRKNCKFARRLDPHIAVLIIQGESDHVLSPKSARKVFDTANSLNKRLVVIPKCGHILLGISRLKPMVSDSIKSFMNEVASRCAVVTKSSAVCRTAFEPKLRLIEGSAPHEVIPH
jgi:alpha-beta hydrolase superfamily lysophospholipase